ncbi:MAG: hypothetical protein WED34_15025 [Planctomycetales bacterium]
MNATAMTILCLVSAIAQADDAAPVARADVLLVVGAEGAPEYGAPFAAWADRWEAAAAGGNARVTTIGRPITPLPPREGPGEGLRVADEADPIEPADRDRLREALAAFEEKSDAPLWIVLIGHGTFDRREAKFNLRGPDFSADELAEWLAPIERPLAIVNCASASGLFVEALSRPGRVVVTATKSGNETDFARFGDFLSQALLDAAADLDRDDQTSLLEAFLFASRRTAEFYEQEGRLATEHAQLDDNGDGRAVRAEDFRGVRPIAPAIEDSLPDGLLAHQWHLVLNAADVQLSNQQRQRRNELERALFRLRERKPELEEAEYLRRLEPLAVELARLYAADGRQ